MNNVFVIMSGLPGTGKTTIAKKLVKKLNANYIRVDTIVQGLLNYGKISEQSANESSYYVGFAQARESLSLGLSVIADSTNLLNNIRNDWKSVADGLNCIIVEVECICSDKIEHRKRIETRQSDIPNYIPPEWQRVVTRVHEPWLREHLIIDTAKSSPDEAVELILNEIKNKT